MCVIIHCGIYATKLNQSNNQSIDHSINQSINQPLGGYIALNPARYSKALYMYTYAVQLASLSIVFLYLMYMIAFLSPVWISTTINSGRHMYALRTDLLSFQKLHLPPDISETANRTKKEQLSMNTGTYSCGASLDGSKLDF